MEATKLMTRNGQSENGMVKLPTMKELISESELSLKENALMVLLNQEPPKEWIKKHPMVDSEYLPINRVEYLLSRIFGKWWVEIRSTQIMANSVAVTVRVYVVNPLTHEQDWQEGCGAQAIQTNKGAGATDWSQVKAAGVQMALPIAESYAIKDAAEKWGKIFGKDLNRKDHISYDSLLKGTVDPVQLRELYEVKKDYLDKDELKSAKRIIDNSEVASYHKLYTLLQGK